MSKELKAGFEEIKDPRQITKFNEDLFRANDLDIHKNEVTEIIDDHKAKKRIYKVKNTKFFDMGRKSR